MKLKDRIPDGCRSNMMDCIRGNTCGADRWPPAEPTTWFAWAPVFWRWRVVLVVEAHKATWHICFGGANDD